MNGPEKRKVTGSTPVPTTTDSRGLVASLVVVVHGIVGAGVVRVDVHVEVVEVGNLVQEPVPDFFGRGVSIANGDVSRDDGQLGDEAVPEPSNLRFAHGAHAGSCGGDRLERSTRSGSTASMSR